MWKRCYDVPSFLLPNIAVRVGAHLTMFKWPPEDIYTIPSKVEIELVTEDIPRLQKELDLVTFGPIELHDETKFRSLRREIALKRAWITASPIKKLPNEILSLIFEECSAKNPKAPLILGAICRRWRMVLLTTPRAFSFLSPSLFPNNRLDEAVLWVERCGTIPLHLTLPPMKDLSQPELDRFLAFAPHIECLNIVSDFEYILGHDFPNVKWLSLGKDHMRFWTEPRATYTSVPPISIDITKFPNLRAFVFHSGLTQAIRDGTNMGSIPPIRELELTPEYHPKQIDLLRAWSRTITYLEISYRAIWHNIKTDDCIYLPVLKRLFYSSPYTSRRVVNLRTPSLTTYIVASGGDSNYIQLDTFNVIRYSQYSGIWPFNPTQYPQLKDLQFISRSTQEVTKNLESILDDPKSVPNLGSIHIVANGYGGFAEEEDEEFEKVVAEWTEKLSQSRQTKVNVTWSRRHVGWASHRTGASDVTYPLTYSYCCPWTNSVS